MLHHLVGGSWGLVIRRPLEAGVQTMPVLALLFVPIAFRDFDTLSLGAAGRFGSDQRVGAVLISERIIVPGARRRLLRGVDGDGVSAGGLVDPPRSHEANTGRAGDSSG